MIMYTSEYVQITLKVPQNLHIVISLQETPVIFRWNFPPRDSKLVRILQYLLVASLSTPPGTAWSLRRTSLIFILDKLRSYMLRVRSHPLSALE